MLGWLVGICDRICAVIGAFVCSQAPVFYQQYTQRLAGHVAESEHQVALLRQAAAQTGKTLALYIEKFLSQSDPDFVGQGLFMQAMVQRLSALQEAYWQLSQAAPWWRPYYLIKYSQADMAEATLRDFQPGVTLTLETTLYAAGGMLLGYGAFRLVTWLARSLYTGICTVLSPFFTPIAYRK